MTSLRLAPATDTQTPRRRPSGPGSSVAHPWVTRIGPALAFSALGVIIAAIPGRGVGATPEQAGDVDAVVDGVVAVGARPLALIENRRLLSYPFEQVWPTAIRYLRIDRGFEVTDRDEEAGYILFTFSLDDARRGSGSLEMFATEDAAGRPSVNVSISTGAGPISLPNTLLDGLAAKVRSERGQPAPPPKQDQPAPPPEQDDPNGDNSVPLLPPAQDP